MSENVETTGTEVETDALPTELEVLKGRATLMGIKFHPNIGVDKLRTLVEDKLADKPAEDVAAPVVEAGEESKEQKRMRLLKEANALVRVRVACMNPIKKEWAGETFCVSNSVVGTIKKFVPFNNEEGWHVPKFILDVMRERQCQIFVTAIGKDGAKLRKSKLIKEFNIEVLPALTQEELKDLAQRQALNQSID